MKSPQLHLPPHGNSGGGGGTIETSPSDLFNNLADLTDDPITNSELTDGDPPDARLSALFSKLDVNGDGRIDVADFLSAINKRGLEISSNKKQSLVKQFFAKSDLDESGDVSLEEFLNYAKKHEKKLKLIFHEIDQNQDGKIDIGEITEVLKRLGVKKVDEGVVREVLAR